MTSLRELINGQAFGAWSGVASFCASGVSSSSVASLCTSGVSRFYRFFLGNVGDSGQMSNQPQTERISCVKALLPRPAKTLMKRGVMTGR